MIITLPDDQMAGFDSDSQSRHARSNNAKLWRWKNKDLPIFWTKHVTLCVKSVQTATVHWQSKSPLSELLSTELEWSAGQCANLKIDWFWGKKMGIKSQLQEQANTIAALDFNIFSTLRITPLTTPPPTSSNNPGFSSLRSSRPLNRYADF